MKFILLSEYFKFCNANNPFFIDIIMENRFSQQHTQQQTQQQTQQLTHAQYQGLELLSKPMLDIRTLLETALAENPLLETAPPAVMELAGDTYGDAAWAGNEIDPSEIEGSREELPLLNSGNDENYPADYSEKTDSDYEQYRQHKLDIAAAAMQSADMLSDILWEQFQNCNSSGQERRALAILLEKIDENGFLKTHLADLAMINDMPMEILCRALEILQSFDPPGIGARDAVESLVLQLKRQNYPDERIYTLLTVHRENLERNKLPEIAKSMKISIDELYGFLDDLKKLNSIPAAGMTAPQNNVVIIPEMSVELENDEVKVIGREDYMPRLRIVSRYEKMLEDPSLAEEDRKYLKEKLLAAQTLIASLAKRQDTLRAITLIIAQKQAEFFRSGEEYLKPMTMAEVAGILDLHETTVSRAVNGKYIATPQGLKELRYFFSSGVKSDDGEDVSSRAVKARIKDLIDNENPAKPLSDAAIANMLAAEGINAARRTVAKYRESMNIPATNLRRHH